MADVVKIPQRQRTSVRVMQPLSARGIGKMLRGKLVGRREGIGMWGGYRIDGTAWRCKCPVCGNVLMVDDVSADGDVGLDCHGGCTPEAVAAELLDEDRLFA